MIIESAPIHSLTPAGPDIVVMGLTSPAIAAEVQPGQFINIRVHDLYQPLLRRPFSVHRVEGDEIFILFNRIGAGTRILMTKRIGETVDILGPLGRPFVLDDDFETALLVGGGMGVAPFPLFVQRHQERKRIVTFVGARSANQVIDSNLTGLHIATDDGTAGYHGTVVDLLRTAQAREQYPRPRLFGCGPNPMLRALSTLAEELNIPCEVSLESAMACGIGICQGCPVETANGGKKYALVCKDGTVFDSRTVRIP